MKKNSKSSFPTSLLAGVAAVLVLGGGFYFLQHKKQNNVHPQAAESSVLSNEKPVAIKHFTGEQQTEIQNIFLQMIREKPELFIGAVNDAMQKQQDNLRIGMEKAASEMKDKLITSGITLGSPTPEVHLVAFYDPMCPHCQDFYRLTDALLQKRHDLAVHLIPIAILGPNSVAMAKIMLTTAEQGTDKMNAFHLKFINKTAEVDRAKLLQMAKDAGIDVAKMEKGELAKETEEKLVSFTKLAEELKIPGVPTIFGLQKDGKFVIVPPMDIEGFNKTIDSLKGGPRTAPAEQTSPVKNNKDES